MASIQTGIELQDNFTSVIMGIINSVNLAVSAMENLDQQMAGDIDTSPIQSARNEINEATIAANQLSRAFQDMTVPAAPAAPQPVQWQSDSLTPVIDVSGMERYQQEIQRTDQMLSGLNDTQAHISQAAASMDILPNTAVQDITSLGTRLNSIRERIQQIENNPVTMGTDAANAQLEQLRAQLHRAVQEQEGLNRAMDSMDISGINSAYMRLSQTISGTERYLRDNTDTQENFNRSVDRCRPLADHAVAGFKGWEKAIILANNALGLVKNTIGNLGITDVSGAFDRIDTMNRFQKTITTMTGDAGMADAALAKLKDTTVGTAYGLDVASKAAQGFLTRGMGLGAATEQVRIWSDAVSFYGEGTNEQLGSVVDAIGKIYSKGSVEADQLDRLFDAGIDAAGIYAGAVGESASKVKEDLSDKNISAVQFIETVSKALDTGVSSGAAKEAGDSWATTFANVKAAATRGWTGVIQSIDDQLAAHGLPSSMELVQSFGQTVENVLGSVADSMGIVIDWGMRIGDTLSSAGTFISDNWGIIEPVLWGIVAALGAYYTAMGLIKAVEIISAGIKIALAVASFAHAAATKSQAGAAAYATAAQYGLNTALLSCPLTWIIVAIIALIAVIVILANHFSGAGHIAQSAFGAIVGAAAAAGAFLLNTVIGIINAILQAVWTAADPFMGIIEWVLNVANGGFDSFGGAVANLIGQVISWFLSLGKVVTRIIDAIFGTDWTDGLNSLQDTVLSWGKNDNAITIDRNAPAIDYRIDYTDAYKAGAEWGDGVSDKVKGFFTIEDPYKGKDKDKKPEIDPNALADSTSLTANNTDDTAKNTAKTANSLSATSEDLKYLRDIAGRDYVNKFTTAEIKVNMTNHNTVNNEMDLDGISKKLREDFEGELYVMAEGVH